MTKGLIEYLPSIYEDIREFQLIMHVEGEEIELLGSRVEDLVNQYYPESATWALNRWERELIIATLPQKPIEQRRSVVISKMRGGGKVSAAHIKNVAEAYDGGRVDVSVSSADYQIKIKFIDTLGVPPNLDDLIEALEEIKPAHMDITYEFLYLFVSDVESMSIAELEATPLSKFAGGVTSE